MRPDIFVLFTRPLWLDEWHTVLVARSDSLAQVIADLNNGSDFGPPLTHLVAWALGKTVGLSPVALHVIAFLCAGAALALLFFTLRRRFDLVPSLAGVLAVASHRLIVRQSVEWRFYAPWLLGAAALAWALTLDADKPASRRRDVAIAIASVVAITSHWFGVISVGLMCAAALATFGVARWREGLRRVAPAAVGFVVLAICLPLVFGQRGSIHEKSWIPDITPAQFWAMLKLFWFAFVPVAAVVLMLFTVLREGSLAQLRAAAAPVIRDPAIAALLACAVMPLLLAVISLKQPAMLERYAITVLLGWAPLMAFATQRLPRIPRAAVAAWLAVLMLTRVGSVVTELRTFMYQVGAAQNALANGCGRGIPVVFQVRHLMYPATSADSLPGCDTRYLAISNATLDAMYGPESRQPRFFRVENEFSALHERLYGYPRVAREETLDTVPAFLLVAWDMSLPSGYKDIEAFRRAVFPAHEVIRITPDLTLFRRR